MGFALPTWRHCSSEWRRFPSLNFCSWRLSILQCFCCFCHKHHRWPRDWDVRVWKERRVKKILGIFYRFSKHLRGRGFLLFLSACTIVLITTGFGFEFRLEDTWEKKMVNSQLVWYLEFWSSSWIHLWCLLFRVFKELFLHSVPVL